MTTAGNTPRHVAPPGLRRRLAPFAALAALIALGLAACGAPKAERAVVASGHPDWPPIMYRHEAVIDGAGPALVKMIFADLGLQAEFPYAGRWDEVQAKAKSGEVDVLVAAYKTTEREGYMVYSDAYTTDPLVLFVKKGKEFPFEKYADLAGKTGVGMDGDSYGQDFDNYIKANLQVRRVPAARQALDLVGRGEADYFIYSLYAGQEELRTERRETEFAALPHFAAEEPFYITISRQSPFVKYLPAINQLVKKYQADGTVDKLIARYRQQFIQEHPVADAPATSGAPQ